MLSCDGVPEKIVCRRSTPPGVAIQVGSGLLEIRRMKVGGAQTSAAIQRKLEEIGSGAGNVRIVHAEPAGALQKSGIGRRQQIDGSS